MEASITKTNTEFKYSWNYTRPFPIHSSGCKDDSSQMVNIGTGIPSPWVEQGLNNLRKRDWRVRQECQQRPFSQGNLTQVSFSRQPREGQQITVPLSLKWAVQTALHAFSFSVDVNNYLHTLTSPAFRVAVTTELWQKRHDNSLLIFFAVILGISRRNNFFKFGFEFECELDFWPEID